MKALLLPVLCIAALLGSCISPDHVYGKEDREIKAERKALLKVAEDINRRYERGEITLKQKEKEEAVLDPLITKHADRTVDFYDRKAAYTQAYREIMAEERAANARAAAMEPQRPASNSYASYSTPSSSGSSFAAPQPLFADRSTSGSSTTSSSSSSRNRSSATSYSVGQTLGGSTRITGNDGSTYTRGQTLGGATQWKSNTGRTYTREQTLGGGYRYNVR